MVFLFFFFFVNHAAWMKWPLLPLLPWRASKMFITRDFHVRVWGIAGRRLVIIPASTLHVFTLSLIGIHSDWLSEHSRQENLLIDGSALCSAASVTTSCANLMDCAKCHFFKMSFHLHISPLLCFCFQFVRVH